MPYQISYSSVLFTRWPQNSLFTGSSKHRLVDGELLTKNRSNRKQIKKENEKQNEIKKKKVYKLNKSKVRKKCNAFSRLEKSKKFLAFYSISFSRGLSDETCYKIFNTWLTRCRRDSGLKSYLWVAERQKNGTVHFHLLTNDYMPIKKVNGFMASCLASEKSKGNEVLKDIHTEKYNGVDVKKVGKNTKSLVGYLTKYITKNDIEFTNLPWHCSRDVSRLFTTINFDEPDDNKYFDMLPRVPSLDENQEKYKIIKTKNYNVAGFKFKPNEKIYSDLDIVNEIIYNKTLKY